MLGGEFDFREEVEGTRLELNGRGGWEQNVLENKEFEWEVLATELVSLILGTFGDAIEFIQLSW